jgi:hypothetical protein
MKFLKHSFVALLMLGASQFAAAQTLSTADYVEIEQLYAKYNHAIDGGDGKAWADTFTADGVFRKTTVGRDALVGFVENFSKSSRGGFRHWNSNLTIVGTPEGADGSVYLMLWNVGVKPQAIVTTGTYIDKLVKTPAGWRFKSRDIKGDAPPPAAAAPASAPVPAK